MNVSGSGSFDGLYSAAQGIQKSAERISSGSKINTAADDSAGVSISNRLGRQINGMSQSIRNANDGVSMLQTAGAGLQNVTEGVQRLRELALQASNGTLTDHDRNTINNEAQHLMSAIQEGVENTSFNNKPLLSEHHKTELQVGAQQGDSMPVEVGGFAQLLHTSGFSALDFSTSEGAMNALGALDQVQAGVDHANADIGAQLNRLDATINTLTNSRISAEESRSRISDTDMAKEVTDMVNNQVKRDTSIAMQAFSNQQKSSILRLLGG